ncbi:hypothetical protein IV102_16730 [bacterium]|nr:hypothetical protein [bacterium]
MSNPDQNKTEAQLGDINSRLTTVETRLDRVETRLDRVDSKLDEHTAKLDEHTDRLDGLSRQMSEQTETIIRHLDIMREEWRSDFRSLREQQREQSGQIKELQQWRSGAEVRVDVLEISFGMLERRVTAVETKPRRKRAGS